jgi:hypothetical protein
MPDLTDAFLLGVDYGLLLAEEERDSEDMFDAFLCGCTARKMNAPSAPARRREPHSAKWREEKKAALVRFAELFGRAQEMNADA